MAAVMCTRLPAKCHFFSYDFVTTGIFRYFKQEILYRLLNRHTLISANGIVEVLGSFLLLCFSSKKTAHRFESQFD